MTTNIKLRYSMALLLIVLLARPMQGHAEGSVSLAQLRAEGANRTMDCAGTDAVVGGSRNTAIFNGSCASLQIRGDANVVTVSLGSGALIDIEGNGNRVKIVATGASAPRLRIMGGSTEVSSAEGALAPAADSAELTGEGQTLALDCAAGAVTLAGARNRIDLRGPCRALTLRGEANVIRASFVADARVLIEGNAIDLIYSVAGNDAPPTVTTRGMGSFAVRAGREAALSLRDPRTKQVTGTVPVLVRDLDATIVEPGTFVKLPSQMFAEGVPTPGGEMQLDRLVALLLQINPRGVQVTGHDGSAELATKRAAAVRGWLASRGVKAVSSQGSVGAGASEIEILALR